MRFKGSKLHNLNSIQASSKVKLNSTTAEWQIQRVWEDPSFPVKITMHQKCLIWLNNLMSLISLTFLVFKALLEENRIADSDRFSIRAKRRIVLNRVAFQTSQKLLLLEIYNLNQEPSNQQLDRSIEWSNPKERWSTMMKTTLGLIR